MIDLNKAGKRTVIGSFHLRWEDTGRKLIILQVVGNTVTALALPGAGFIGAGTLSFININLTFHNQLLPPDESFLRELNIPLPYPCG